MLPISECKDGKTTTGLTLTRVRIPIIDSKIAFVGVVLTVSLKVVRISMSALSTAVIAEWCSVVEGALSTAQGSKVDMVQGER